jgi:hypothetical protein
MPSKQSYPTSFKWETPLPRSFPQSASFNRDSRGRPENGPLCDCCFDEKF